MLWSNEASLLVQWRTLNTCFCTLCAVGAAVSASLLSEHVIIRHSEEGATVVGEVTSPSSDTMCHSCAPVAYTVRDNATKFT